MYTESSGATAQVFVKPQTTPVDNRNKTNQPTTYNTDTVSIGGSQPGKPQTVLEFSVEARIQRTFEGSFSYSNGGREVSAYVKSSETAEFKLNMKMTQADALAQTQINAMQDPSSPEAVAQRITDFALGFFPMFAADNPNMSKEEQITAFKTMVEGAIDQGFSEAMATLGSMPGEVTNQINETRDIIQQQLDSFFEYLRGDGAKAGNSAVENGTWGDFVTEFMDSVKEAVA